MEHVVIHHHIRGEGGKTVGTRPFQIDNIARIVDHLLGGAIVQSCALNSDDFHEDCFRIRSGGRGSERSFPEPKESDEEVKEADAEKT